MKKTLVNLVGLSMLSLCPMTAQVINTGDKVCFEAKADRWNDDTLGNITIDAIFNQTSGNPNAPSSFPGSFGISYTGNAPQQVISGGFLSFSFDPSATTVTLPGIDVPDFVVVDGEKWELCHTCYDFSVDIKSEVGVMLTVLSDGKDPFSPDKDGNYIGIDSPISLLFTDDNGDPIKSKTLVTVTLDNVEVCYCIPEPSTVSLGVLALLGLVTRRKR